MKLNKKYVFYTLCTSFVFLFSLQIILAQEDTVNIQEVAKQNAKDGEIAFCSQYYKYGGVTVDIFQNFKTYEAGEPIVITGTVQNTSSRFITDLSLKARLVKDIPEADPATSQFIILDEFFITENKNIKAGEEFDVAYSYVLPLNAPTGSYKILIYALESDTFDLAGTYFADDLTAATLTFDVEGEEMDHVYLDQTQIMIGDQAYTTSNPYTAYTGEDSVAISIPVYNPDSETKEMKITYDLYSWDSRNVAKKIRTTSENVSVSAQSETKLTYALEKSNIPVSYLSITAEPLTRTRDASVFQEKTISNIRLSTNPISLPRLTYVGVTEYPLKRGTEATLVTCFANMSEQYDETVSRIETVLYDQDKKEIARTVYEGQLFSDVSAIVKKFKPTSMSSQFSVASYVYDSQNTVIDSFEKTYSCEDIDPNLCSDTKQNPSFLMVVVFAGIILALVTLLFKRKDINDLKI